MCERISLASMRVVNNPIYSLLQGVVFTLLLCFALGTAELSAATFTVDSTNHSPDANPGDGFALDAFNDTSLLAAIEEANALSGADTIVFDNSFAGTTWYFSDSQFDVTDDLLLRGFPTTV